MRKLLQIALLAALALLTMGVAAPARAQATPRTRCFSETGYCVSDPLLRYWERNGGLAVFGFPVSEQREETVEGRTIPVQWFERDRLEIQLDGTITAGRLGARALELQGRRWELTPPAPRQPAEAGCRYFPETGRNLCWPFLDYWERNGGLERFGYPITELRAERVERGTYAVQYFERRRMEHHPEFAGTGYEILLGLLGRSVLEVQALPPCRQPRDVQFGIGERVDNVSFRNMLLCPTESYGDVPAALQEFERGRMIWVDLGAGGRKVIVYRYPGELSSSTTYAVYDDTYQEGEPPIQDTPPIYRQVPQRGFGKVWAAGEKRWLGYATQIERADTARVQYFGGGGFAVQLLGANQVWIFGPTLDLAEQW
jgi:hypothetical protein